MQAVLSLTKLCLKISQNTHTHTHTHTYTRINIFRLKPANTVAHCVELDLYCDLTP